jgi:hypothetical protein
MTAIEEKELKGITLKNLLITMFSTISIVASVVITYSNLKADITNVKDQQELAYRVYDVRLKVLESQVSVLQADVKELKEGKNK